MLLNFGLFAVGLIALYFGSEWMVDGASRLARSFGVSAFVVGLTVVAFGTSAPELLVTGLASAEGRGDIAVGNIIGSNIANIALILGVSALIRPMRVHRGAIVRDVPIMIGFTLLLVVIGWGSTIARWEGLLLLALFAAYMVHLARDTRREAEAGTVPIKLESDAPPARSRLRSAAFTVVGLVLLLVGAQLLVTSAVSIARDIGVPEVVIGLTLVALGTSLPELATSVAASRRGDAQMVLGNVVGSNIFNISLILGVAALIRPLPIAPGVMAFDGPLMIVLSVALLPLVYTGMKLNRWEGAGLLALYFGSVVWTVAS